MNNDEMNYSEYEEREDGLTANEEEILSVLKKKQLKKGRIQGFVAAIIIIVIISGIRFVSKLGTDLIDIAALRYGTTKNSVIDDKTKKKIDVLTSIIEKNYLEEYDREGLENGLYKGLIEGLGDEYSVYYDEEEYAELTEDSDGVFEGIGAYLTQNAETKVVTVVRPIQGSPAEKAGLLADDIIVEVDGENVVGDDLDVTVSKIRGEAGTTVQIGVKRKGQKNTLYFDIVRASVESVSVEGEMLEDKIGYIYISEFTDVTSEQFNEQLNTLKKDGMKGLVLDLRGNPGGSVRTSVEVADMLLKEGLVVYTEDKKGERSEYTSDAEHYYDDPLVVLVDSGSASAAEILTGALKDYKAGKVIGTTTFGKGIVQQVMPLGDGSGVKITISKYYTPNGVNIHGVGIEPDEEIEFDSEAYLEDETDNQLNRAMEIIKSELK